MMPPMENLKIGSQIPSLQTNPSSENPRKGPLRSQTVDTLLRILSICSADSSRIIQDSDKSGTHIGSEAKETSVESFERDHNISGERKDLFQRVDTIPSNSVDTKKQDNYDMMISSPRLPTDKDVEEGEISREFSDFMPEDDKSLTPSSTDTVGKDMASVASKTTRNLVDYSELAGHGRSRENDFASLVKESGAQNNKKRQGSCAEEERTNKETKKSSENLTLHEDATQEVDDASKNMDANNEKKKKRVLTKERKEKKKRKERIKRAEKNRKLGVKRLKLQLVIKEKKITYCRHYLKGRCHEGEKCKFSHDTIPLTKSKPCCHFARHSCMKGDDCPFDHQLSKYPCNNHLSKGFCSRGSDCMFSHEVQPSQTPINVESNPEQNPSSVLDNSGSKKLKSVNGSSHEKMDTKSCSERNLVEVTPKPSAQPPKGISFLSQEKLPQTEVKGQASDAVQDSKEITKAPLVVPRGINFLSFGKKPGLDSSFKMGNGIGKSLNVEVEGSKSNDEPKPNSTRKPMHMLPFMSIASRRALQSTIAFASGVKINMPENSSQNL